MPAPALARSISLSTIRDDLVYTHARLTADPRARSQASVIERQIETWAEIHAAQLAHWDAQARADAAVAAADDGLDDFVVDFAAEVRTQPGGEKSAVWKLYFKAPPHELAAPVLGGQLEDMKHWQKLLAKEREPRLAAMKPRLDELIKAADKAAKARADANAANESFRATGDLAKYLTTVQQKRDGVAAALDALAADDPSLSRGYSSRFFRRRTVKVSAEEKAAKAAQREADRKAKAEAAAKVKEARAKVKEALRELRTATKKG